MGFGFKPDITALAIMTSHSHSFGSKKWPFDDLQDAAVFCCSCVLAEYAILRVVRDLDDGEWQMLCGRPVHDAEDPVVVCFGCVVENDPSLRELSALPFGWCADRISRKSPWIISENT